MSTTMRPVTGSSAIIAEGYDPATRTLTLRFAKAKEDTVIEDVSPETYYAFLAAPSKGKFFHERLRT